MEKYKIKKNGKYQYLYHYGKKVAGINPKGKMWGITHHFNDFKKLLNKVK